MTTRIPRRTPPIPLVTAAPLRAALLFLMGAALGCSTVPSSSTTTTTSTTAPPPAQTAPGADGTADGTAALVPISEAPTPAVAAAPPPEPAPEPPPPPPPKEPVMEWREGRARPAGSETDDRGAHVFTNADLSRYKEPGDQAPSDAVAEGARAQAQFDKDSLKKVQDQPATDAWKARTKAEAEDRVRVAEARLEALRRLSLSDANPLLPQPRLAEEAEKKRQGLSREERYKMTQQEIQQAEAELAEAKANLDKVLKQLAPPR